MNYKKMFSGLLVLIIVLVLGVMVYANTMHYFSLSDYSPKLGGNVSGSINLSTVFIRNASIVNVSFMLWLSNSTYAAQFSSYSGNVSLMVNQTYQNQTVNSTFFGNESYFDTSALPDGV